MRSDGRQVYLVLPASPNRSENARIIDVQAHRQRLQAMPVKVPSATDRALYARYAGIRQAMCGDTLPLPEIATLCH